MDWMDWAYYGLLLVVLIASLALNVVGLPGLWVAVLASLGYAWLTGWSYVGIGTLVTITVLSLIAEALEFITGAAAAKKVGGSKRAMILAAVGAVVGAIVLSPILVVPGIAQVVGAVLGAGIGGLVGELMTGRGTEASVKVGIESAKGRFVGTVLKLTFGVVVAGIVAVVALPWGGRKVPPAGGGGTLVLPAPTTAEIETAGAATLPATAPVSTTEPTTRETP